MKKGISEFELVLKPDFFNFYEIGARIFYLE